MADSPFRCRRLVYVTSTFRDMRAEREMLRTVVFPELDQRLRQRHCRLEWIDHYRQAEPGSAEEDQTRELSALKVCLGEISRGQPVQIVLLGDCYGWVPPDEKLQAACAEAGLAGELSGKSIAALEIEFGLKHSADGPSRCFYYFREPLGEGRIPREKAADYSDPAQASQLAELKARIEQEAPDRVRRYEAEWDEENQSVAGLKDWGQSVLDDLWEVFEAETDALADLPPPSWQDDQERTLGQLIDTLARDFVGREEVVESLLELARAPAGNDASWGACVTAISGVGKSALFAHLHRRLEDDEQKGEVVVLSHAAGIGAGAMRVDAMLRRWTSRLASVLEIDNPVRDTSTSREVETSFHGLLAEASRQQPVVLLIDALDQFEQTPRAQKLAWLPEPWPANARLIATTLPGNVSERLERLPGVNRIPLPPLEAGESDRIIEAISSRYHRTLKPEVVEVLRSKRLAEGSWAVGVPLWLRLAVEQLLLFDADDCGGLDPARLDAAVLNAARQFPSDVEALYGWVLQRLETRHGAGFVQVLCNLIALSRNGLRAEDLEVLLPKVGKLIAPTNPREPWDPLKFALLRRGLRGHLTQHDVAAEWDFSHAQLREAVMRRNLRDSQVVQRLHTGIAYHLKSRPASDPLHQTELMVHLIESEDRLRAAHYYSSDLDVQEAAGATRALADHILAGASQTPNSHLARVASLLIEPKLDKSQRALLCRRYNTDLSDMLDNNAPVEARRDLAEATRNAAKEQLAHDPENADWRQALALSCVRLARCYEEAGNEAEAQGYRTRWQETLRSLRDANVALEPILAGLLADLDP